MKSIIGLVVAGLILCAGVEGHARPHRHHRAVHAAHVAKRRANHWRHHARRAIARPARDQDELALSPALMMQLQRNLAGGGYLDGPIDGRLTPRTHIALAAFEREYHLPRRGALTRASAEALLGHDAIGTFTVASATR